MEINEDRVCDEHVIRRGLRIRRIVWKFFERDRQNVLSFVHLVFSKIELLKNASSAVLGSP